ncbi:MAG: hypothetical protein ACI9C1_003508 [Candidatus Aldehydirespiratoraceae bacterium]|jgi:hypothetical protein
MNSMWIGLYGCCGTSKSAPNALVSWRNLSGSSVRSPVWSRSLERVRHSLRGVFFFWGGEGGRVVPVAACLADGNLVNVNNGAMNQGSLRNAMATLFGIT